MKKMIFFIFIILATNSVGFSYSSDLISIELKLINPQTGQEIELTQNMEKPEFPLKCELHGIYSDGKVRTIDSDIEWIISDEKIAQIDGAGYLFFLNEQGFLTIEAQYKNKKAIYYTSIKWKNSEREIETLKISGNRDYSKEGNDLLILGKTKYGELVELDENEVLFSSSDRSVAYVVNQKLYFTGKIGMCVITTTYKNITESFTIDVNSTVIEKYPSIRDVVVNPIYPGPYDEVTFEVISNYESNRIEKEEWKGKQRFYDEGIYLPSVRIMTDLGYFSDWYSIPLFVGGEIEDEENNVFSTALIDISNLRRNIFVNLLSDNEENYEVMDIENHWAKDQIVKAIKIGFVLSDSNKKFNPDKLLNREEIAMIICKALGFSEVIDYSFEDLDNSKYKGYVYALNQKGIMNGYNDGLFKPNKVVSRGEFAQIISRVFDYNYIQKYTYNNSISDISHYWGKDAIEQIVAMKLMQGDKENKFNPLEPISKAECTVVLKRMLEKDPLIKGVIEWVD